MKILKFVNGFALSLPFILALLGFINDGFMFWAVYSIMLTGLLQVVVAFCALILGHYKNHLTIYFTAVSIYFVCMFLNINGYYLYFMPVLLAIFLTIIIHKTVPHES